ncbi:MAG: vWA domain-containing protein [Phycisphaerales bacterium]
MTFAHPWVLLLLGVPVVLAWSVVARGWGLVLPFDHQPHVQRRWLRWMLGAFDVVPLLLLATAIVILAGPQTLQQPRRERSLSNIQFCMDVSGSMAGPRYEMARSAIEGFTREREGDAFGLTIFGSEQIRWVPLTKDLVAIRNAMPFANPERQPLHMAGTRIGAALRFCRDNMLAEAGEGDRMIVLVSDGDSSDLGNGEEFEIAEMLQEAKITVYHIHVAEDDIPQEVVEIARATGGEAFAAHDPASLKRVFNHIDRMRPATFKSKGTVPMDHFGPFALVALGLIGFHLVGLLGARYTPW